MGGGHDGEETEGKLGMWKRPEAGSASLSPGRLVGPEVGFEQMNGPRLVT